MTTPDPCFTDYALQEYVAGRLDPGVREEVEAHAAVCDACRSAAGLLREEAGFLRAALEPAGKAPAEPLDSLLLAAYLGDALDTEETAILDARLAGDASSIVALLRLRAETLATLDECGTGVREEVPPVPSGVVLRMPTRRIHPPRVIQTNERKYGGGPGA